MYVVQSRDKAQTTNTGDAINASVTKQTTRTNSKTGSDWGGVNFLSGNLRSSQPPMTYLGVNTYQVHDKEADALAEHEQRRETGENSEHGEIQSQPGTTDAGQQHRTGPTVVTTAKNNHNHKNSNLLRVYTFDTGTWSVNGSKTKRLCLQATTPHL
jgi:hypothetical protein